MAPLRSSWDRCKACIYAIRRPACGRAQAIARGKDAYLRLGAGPLKNLTCLNYNNMMSKAVHFWKYGLNADLSVDLPNTLHLMMQSGKFYPSTAFVTGKGLDLARADVRSCPQSIPECIPPADRPPQPHHPSPHRKLPAHPCGTCQRTTAPPPLRVV